MPPIDLDNMLPSVLLLAGMTLMLVILLRRHFRYQRKRRRKRNWKPDPLPPADRGEAGFGSTGR